MPMVFKPAPKADDFKELKKKAIRELLDERIALHQQQKRIKQRLDGNEKKGEVGLNLRLYGELSSAVPEDVRSLQYEGHLFVFYQGEPQMRLDQEALTQTPFKVKCPCGCAKKFDVMLPVSVLNACKKPGKEPKPTLSVKTLGDADEE